MRRGNLFAFVDGIALTHAPGSGSPAEEEEAAPRRRSTMGGTRGRQRAFRQTKDAFGTAGDIATISPMEKKTHRESSLPTPWGTGGGSFSFVSAAPGNWPKGIPGLGSSIVKVVPIARFCFSNAGICLLSRAPAPFPDPIFFGMVQNFVWHPSPVALPSPSLSLIYSRILSSADANLFGPCIFFLKTFLNQETCKPRIPKRYMALGGIFFIRTHENF